MGVYMMKRFVNAADNRHMPDALGMRGEASLEWWMGFVECVFLCRYYEMPSYTAGNVLPVVDVVSVLPYVVWEKSQVQTKLRQKQ